MALPKEGAAALALGSDELSSRGTWEITLRKMVWPFAAGGCALGVALVAAAFWAARLGHGTYAIWAAASLPGMVAGMGRGPWVGMLFLFVAPILQWTLLGLAVGKIIRGNRGWLLVVLAVGLAYLAASYVAHEQLGAYCAPSEVARLMIIGCVTGSLMLGGCVMAMCVLRKAKH